MAHTGISPARMAKLTVTPYPSWIKLINWISRITLGCTLPAILTNMQCYGRQKTHVVQAVYTGKLWRYARLYQSENREIYALESHVYPVLPAKANPKAKSNAKVVAIVKTRISEWHQRLMRLSVRRPHQNPSPVAITTVRPWKMPPEN